MLNPKFKYAFQEFQGLKEQICFSSAYAPVAKHFGDDQLKWIIPGLGEAIGYWMILQGSENRFMLYTLTQMEELPEDFVMEWNISAESHEAADEVFHALGLSSDAVRWKKSES